MSPEERAKGVVERWEHVLPYSIADEYRDALVACVVVAITKALASDRAQRQPVPGSLLSVERLEAIRQLIEHTGDIIWSRSEIAALLAHADALASIIGDMVADGSAEQWQAGRRAGLEQAAALALEQYMPTLAKHIRALEEP